MWRENIKKYTERGMKVFPVHTISNGVCTCGNEACPAPGKHPMTPHGFKDASVDSATIHEALWNLEPTPNVGIATGPISGIIVLDVDPKNGGNESLLQLEAEIGTFSDAWEVNTGGGGKHFYFSYPADASMQIKSCTNLCGYSGLDIRAKGGYVVAPPSLHISGKPYEWVKGNSPNDRPLEDAPPGLLELCMQMNKAAQDDEIIPIKRESWIAEILADLHEGNRHDSLLKVTGRLSRDGYNAAEIVALLIPHAKGCGFPLDELVTSVKSIVAKDTASRSSFSSINGRNGDHEEEAEPLALLTAAELFNLEFEPISWLVDKWIPMKAASIIAGTPGSGKTWFMLDLALACCTGGKWLGQFPVPRGRVIYIDEENSKPLIRKRLAKLASGRGIPPSIPGLAFMVGQGLCLRNQRRMKQLAALIEDFKPSVIFIDSLVRVHGADENSATEMAKSLREIKSLIQQFKVCVVISDHQRKQIGFSIDPKSALRGSSDKAAFVDALLSLLKNEDKLTLSHSKARMDEQQKDVVIEMKDDETHEKVFLKFIGEATEVKATKDTERVMKLLSVILRPGVWLSRQEILEPAERIGISSKALDGGLKALIELDPPVLVKKKEKSSKTRGGKQDYYKWITEEGGPQS